MRVHGAPITHMEWLYLFATNHSISFTYALYKQQQVKSFNCNSIGKAKCVSWKWIAQYKLILVINNAIAVAVNKFHITRRYYLVGKFGRIFQVIQVLKIPIALIAIIYGNRLSY